jgi:hypothetical protein
MITAVITLGWAVSSGRIFTAAIAHLPAVGKSHRCKYKLYLRKKWGETSCHPSSCSDRHSHPCRFSVYYLREPNHARGKSSTPNSAPHYQNEAKKSPASPGIDPMLIQLHDEQWMQQILPKMAANVQILKTKQAKKSQVHLLRIALGALLQEDKQ